MACSNCADSCTGSCNDTCTGTCYNGCSGCGGGCSHCSNCSGGCQGGCGDTCKGSCTDCSGCSGSCSGKCKGCTGSCSGKCDNGCQSAAKNELITNFPLDDVIKASDLNNVIEQINAELKRRDKTSTTGANLATVSSGELPKEITRDNIYNDIALLDSTLKTIKKDRLNRDEMLTYIEAVKTLANTILVK